MLVVGNSFNSSYFYSDNDIIYMLLNAIGRGY